MGELTPGNLTLIMMIDVAAVLRSPGYQFKAVFNEGGIILAPVRVEHNTLKAPGISYEQNHKGNALAAMIYQGQIEIRGDPAFRLERVRNILSRLRRLQPLGLLGEFQVTYKGAALGRLADICAASQG